MGEEVCERCDEPLRRGPGSLLSCPVHGVAFSGPDDGAGPAVATAGSEPGASPAAGEPGRSAAAGSAAAGGAPAPLPCNQHRNVPSVVRCQACKRPLCATCELTLAGDFHVCPTCATDGPRGLSDRRKKSVIAAYILAGLSTVFYIGFIFHSAQSKASAEAIGLVYNFLVFGPAAVGLGFALAPLEKRLPNPRLIWGAVIWSAAIVGLNLLTIIVGFFIGD